LVAVGRERAVGRVGQRPASGVEWVRGEHERARASRRPGGSGSTHPVRGSAAVRGGAGGGGGRGAGAVLRSPSRELRLHPLALLRRLAWLVPPPRPHQVQAFGVLAPAARLRPKVVPVGRVAVQGRWFGTQRFEPTERVPYREAWARLLSRVYDVDGHACPRCPGRLRPFGAVLPPEAAEWVRRSQFVAVESTGPPPRRACRQVCLPFVS
jgi:hypothetical protein